MLHDTLAAFERTSLDRLRLAADVILSEAEALPDPLTAELTLFKERVERALLLPAASKPDTGSAVVALQPTLATTRRRVQSVSTITYFA